MPFGAIIQTAAGIVVSIGLFVVGYRQTIGARKERAKTATTSLVRVLSRRLVLEEYHPKYADIERLIEGRSLEHQVRSADLLRPNQILAMVYAQVFDSDLITPERRTEVEAKIVQALADGENRNSGPAAQTSYSTWTIILALFTTLTGGLIMTGLAALGGRRVDPVLLTIALSASLLVIGTIILTRRLRESGDRLLDWLGSHEPESVLPRKVERVLDGQNVPSTGTLRSAIP